ncbi:hypothetical protein [Umezakia ovalisporum]|jgi:hypothetical protein|uniref:Uncharacterized protein n=2 Tax=Umezakia ovalisporum TaxID=75695 RepID=A0AA43GWU2_9CYAN|nr:hypothetical protein [Umezakia ovalisporum]MBI1241671.1 hypothetical protein [Nostoc sp. RI_552]MDH6055853.1 hypothetical protein [Umezakia ovalisporum FSS-43]MDH6063199.1 hypothetical protein [Umezakia ovalisporum FSS-62]MDH6068913.1 hypothetical protein [Umezakia ovalisporum APH033B]MDH6070661.1 hypothetical protein [Umezakia ovalisporum CobakiLakeA]
MANITLSQLYSIGSELFHDSETFFHELSHTDSIFRDEYAVVGGIIFTALTGAFVSIYGIGHATYVAKSYSGTYPYPL